jgi:hypothetical protein
MVQVIEGNNFWRDIGMQAGEGFMQGYNQRSDDMAIRNVLDSLPSNANPRDVLNTILGAKASPEAKKRATEGYIKGVELEQSALKAKAEQAKIDREEREKSEKLQREKQNVEAIIDASDLSPEEKEAYKQQITSETAAKQVAKLKEKSSTQVKQEEKQQIYETGIKTIDRMRNIGKKGNLGRTSILFKGFGGETDKDFAEYEQLGKSLIALSTTIPIRNRLEFETLAHNLYDPSLTDSAREGILNALESILKSNLITTESTTSELPTRHPLSSFKR